MSDTIDSAEVDRLLDEVFDSPGAPTFPPAFTQAKSTRQVNPATLILDSGPLTADHVQIATDHIAAGTPMGMTQGSVKRLRHTHHRLAQLLASGIKDGQAGVLCGYEAARVSYLKNHDPAFKELLAFYASEVNSEFSDFVQSAGALSMDLLDKLRQDLEEHPEKFTPTTTLDAIRTLADRSGNAPVSKSVNVNVNSDMADRLRAARERVAASNPASHPPINVTPNGSH